MSIALILLLVILVIDIGTALYAVGYGEYPASVPRGDPTAYKIIYLHVPMAWVSYLAFGLGFLGSIIYLLRGSNKFDRIAYTSINLGAIYGIGAILSGSAWANETWGTPWVWEPRLTSTLIMWLVYVGYIALRHSIREPEKRKVISASYASAAIVTVPISYMSAVIFESLHEQIPQQPLTSSILMLMGIRAIEATLTFMMLEYFYYKFASRRAR